MKALSLLAAASSVLFLSLAPARAQNLGEILAQTGLGAIIGTWVDADTKGENATVTYAWRIPNHALALSAKGAHGSSEALIAFDPANEQVVHVSVDDQGRFAKGTWSEKDGLAVLALSRVDADGATLKLEISHKIVNGELVVGMRNVETDEGGEFTLVRKAE